MSNNATEGPFLDPKGFLMTLRASTPEAFRVLVTRKLEAGWKVAPSSPAVVPLKHEEVIAIPPVMQAVVAAPVALSRGAWPELEVALVLPTDEERAAAVAEALGVKDGE